MALFCRAIRVEQCRLSRVDRPTYAHREVFAFCPDSDIESLGSVSQLGGFDYGVALLGSRAISLRMLQFSECLSPLACAPS